MAQNPAGLIKAQETPVIDGYVNEKAWQNVHVFSDFRTMHPEPGHLPSEKTKVYITYSQSHIYLGFVCSDSKPDKIVTGKAQRDNPANDDWVAFCLDTFNDHLGAYIFLLAAGGEKTDGILNSEGSPSFSFNTHWSAAAKQTDYGYTAEIAIPFKNLVYSWKKELTMGFKIARFISRNSIEVDYPGIFPDRSPHLSQFRKIKLSGIVKSSTSDSGTVVNVSEKLQQKIKLSREFDINTLDGRCRAWGDASVVDYKLFPATSFGPVKIHISFKRMIRKI